MWDPLDPSGDEARSMLREELARPEYHDTDLLRRLIDWAGRVLDGAIGAASGWSPVRTLAALLVVLLLAVAVILLASRTRRNRSADVRQGGVLTAESISAAELRRRADTALASGRADEALLDGFRALTLRQIERGRLDNLPGATAHEVALSLEDIYPTHNRRVDESAAAFDQVLYGGRAATEDQARAVLGLDDDLAGVR